LSAFAPLLGTWPAEVAVFLDDRSWCEALYSMLSSMTHEYCAWSMGMIDGPLARPLFLLAAALGKWDEAARRHQEALARKKVGCEAYGGAYPARGGQRADAYGVDMAVKRDLKNLFDRTRYCCRQ
jgi:hypothetical protein